MFVKKPDLSKISLAEAKDIIKKWHPRLNATSAVALVFMLSTIILGVKSCKSGKEIENLEADKNKLHEEVVTALNALQEKAEETNSYAMEASQVCGLREENQELRDSIQELGGSNQELIDSIGVLNAKLKKCQAQKKTVRRTVRPAVVKPAAQDTTPTVIEIKVKRTYHWDYSKCR